MVLKTFNIDEKAYKKFSEFCREHGISMSRQIDLFIKSKIEELEIRPEYIKKLEKIRKGKYTSFSSISELRDSIENV